MHSVYSCVVVFCLVTTSCLTLCGPMDSSLPGSSVYVVLQESILEWVAMPSGNRPHSGIKSASPALAGRFFITELPGKPVYSYTHSIYRTLIEISGIHIYVNILPQIPLLSGLAHNIEQSFMWYTIGSYSFSILNTAVCTRLSRTFCLSLPSGNPKLSVCESLSVL